MMGSGADSPSAVALILTLDPTDTRACVATSIASVSWSQIANVSGRCRWSSTTTWMTLGFTAAANS